MKTWLLSPLSLGFYCAIFCLAIVGCGGSPQNTSSTPASPLAIQSITPSSVPAGSAPLTITISGTGFTSSSLVTVNNTQVPTVYVSTTQLQATVPADQLASGVQLQVGVTNGTGSSTITTAALSVDNPAPVLLSIAPSSIAAGLSSANVTLTGSGFTPTSTASINGSVRPTTFTNATQITVSLTAADLAVVTNSTITVTNSTPGGGTSSGQPFSVVNPLPVIASISPASLPVGSSSTSLDIVGTNFLPATTVSWNNSTLTATFISSTELSATVPSTSLAAGAVASVTLSNPAPGGGVSAPVNFQVVSPKPALTSILPGNVAVGKAATITLTGSGFETNSVVQWNGSDRPTTFVSTTSLQVALSAADLTNSGIGKLLVTNPAPGGGSSSASTLNVTPFPIPAIQGITLATESSTACSTIQATITGTNFASGDTVQLNGFSLRPSVVFPTSPGNYQMQVSLLAAAIPKSGPLTFTVTNNFFPPIVSDPYTLPATGPAVVALCSSPEPANVYANTSFTVFLTAAEINSTAVPAVSLGALPAGIALTSPASISIPSSGVALGFTASGSVVPGTYSIPVTGQAGSLSITGSIQVIVQAGSPPSFFFTQPLFRELGVPIGGSNQIQFSSIANGNADYNIVPTVSGLPPGTTATVSPSTIIPGQSVTVVVTAASTAPVSQNVTVTLTGTPSAAVSPAQTTFLLDVTAPPGSLPGNRTDFTSTAGTPYAAVYDSAHNLIFASNPSWNRVDIISNQTHKIVGSVNIRDPLGIDIATDNSKIWVATGSQELYSIDTSTFAVTRLSLPNMYVTSTSAGTIWEGGSVLVLSDGTLLLQTNPSSGGTSVVWTPGTGNLTALNGFSGPLLRSGDHSRVYVTSVNSVSCQTSMYNATSKAVTTFPATSEICSFDAVNTDGSRLVGSTNGTYGIYDGNFNLLGNLPGVGYSSGINFNGGFIFSPDGSTLYQIGTSISQPQPVILTYDVASLTLKGIAPAMATLPVGVSETPNLSMPFAIDPTGMILGIQDFGIGFDDSTFFQAYAASQPAYSAFFIPPSPDAGAIGGGTISGLFPSYSLTPDAWYGENRGAASLSSSSVSITSPPGDAVGPVNLKYLFPDGNQVFNLQAFSYSTYLQYATLAGASPNGGAPGQIVGYGMPADASGGTMTVGGQTATITTAITQYPPYTGEPFPSTFLNYTIPAGNPGWADLQIQTPIGTGTLPKSVFYAKSVTDYSSSDTFTAVLFDRKRNQVYLSAKNHIDVFSLSSGQFVSPLVPAINSGNSQFAGLALTPDGSQLLATNTLDGSLAVINPDSPSSTYAIAVAGFSGTNSCTVGPLYVATTSNGQAFVTTGSIPGKLGCPSEGNLYIVNLAAKSVSRPPNISTCSLYVQYPFTTSFGVDAPLDGSYVAMGPGTYGGECLYSVASNSYSLTAGSVGSSLGVTMSGDGNIIGSGVVLDNAVGVDIGRLAHPTVFYGSNLNQYAEDQVPANALYNPRLNDSGSLYFWPFPNYFEIVDVPTGRLRLRFSLTEKVQNVVAPLALDGGHDVFLITDNGLTIVDLGSSPLSIGHLSSSTGSAGSQIKIRGSGFGIGITGTIGGQSATVNLTDENTLTITVPALSSGLKDLALTNPDGSTYLLQSAISVP
jgi:hypothetical protein